MRVQGVPADPRGDNRDLLWAGIEDGTIDAIVSDHSPCTAAMKQRGNGDFAQAWGGLSGLQTGLAAVWTEARERGIALEMLLPLMSTGPARVAGLAGRGRIAVGAPAHLVVLSPDAVFTVDAHRLEYRNPVTPWDGKALAGVIEATYLAGERVYIPGEGIGPRHGQEILATRPAPPA